MKIIMINIVPRLIIFAVIAVVMLIFVVKAMRSRVTTGAEGMIGKKGKVKTPLAPEGQVLVNGELWAARAQGGEQLEPGTKVEVLSISTDGFEIVVKSIE